MPLTQRFKADTKTVLDGIYNEKAAIKLASGIDTVLLFSRHFNEYICYEDLL